MYRIVTNGYWYKVQYAEKVLTRGSGLKDKVFWENVFDPKCAGLHNINYFGSRESAKQYITKLKEQSYDDWKEVEVVE